MTENWTCPFCEHHSTISSENVDDIACENYTLSKDGLKSLRGRFVVCPNPDCKKLCLSLRLHKALFRNGRRTILPTITHSWNLIPDSMAKAYSSEIIPQAIIEDYEEACKIKNLSPKSSATLARRALQGMIRDFWKVKKPTDHKGKWTLWHEIQAIKDLPELGSGVWTAIDALRTIGNIGAHMEEDINIIINVEPEVADKLIWLIEFLLDKWYIQRHETTIKLAEIVGIADSKTEKKA